MPKPAEYDLWFDESGQFMESARGPSAGASRQSFPSQLAGVLVPRGKLTTSAAEVVLGEAHRVAKLPFEDEVHASGMPPEALDALVAKLVAEIQARGWQPVRLVNHEGVTYGDRVSTYTQMVAELVLRVFRELASRGHETIDLHVFGALVKLGTDAYGGPELLDDDQYRKRLNEAVQFVGIRRGVPDQAARWRIAGLSLLSGRRRRELQLCDVISNASHAKFKKLSPDTRATLQAAFGALDQTLVVDELLESVDDLVNDLALGRALVFLAEAALDPERARDDRLRERIGIIVARLAAMGPRARDPELRSLETFLEQVIELQRSPSRGSALVAFLLREVETPLRSRLDAEAAATIDWFTYALHRWALTAANHAGDLVAAKAAASRMDALARSLAGSWEHAPRLMDGMVAQAVHRTDCFAYDEASALMKAVAGYYGELSGLFSAALPGVFPERIRSRARGEALGTRLQAEMYASLRDPARREVARALSDEALDELTWADDKARQRQYRCQLETIAGELPTARELLASSLGVASPTHAAIAGAIVALGHPAAQGFALLHWLRLGRAASTYAGAEREDFLAAWKASKVLGLAWFTGQVDEYPVHGILRQAAGIHAISGATREALGCLTLLRRARATMALSTVTLAATVEVAGLLWGKQQGEAERLLDNKDKERPGALQLLKGLGDAARDDVPELWAVFAPWDAAIRGLAAKGAAHKDARDVLLALGRAVPY